MQVRRARLVRHSTIAACSTVPKFRVRDLVSRTSPSRVWASSDVMLKEIQYLSIQRKMNDDASHNQRTTSVVCVMLPMNEFFVSRRLHTRYGQFISKHNRGVHSMHCTLFLSVSVHTSPHSTFNGIRTRNSPCNRFLAPGATSRIQS